MIASAASGKGVNVTKLLSRGDCPLFPLPYRTLAWHRALMAFSISHSRDASVTPSGSSLRLILSCVVRLSKHSRGVSQLHSPPSPNILDHTKLNIQNSKCKIGRAESAPVLLAAVQQRWASSQMVDSAGDERGDSRRDGRERTTETSRCDNLRRQPWKSSARRPK